jgi:SAM-dependent methyltransferase
MQTAHQQHSRPGHGDGHSNGSATAHPHAAPATEGRLIHWARLYDVLLRFMFMGRLGAVRAMTLDLAAIEPGERVLDAGCGTGQLALAAARRVGRSGVVHGIDASPEMLQVARRNARRSGRSVQFHLEPLEATSFADGSFDVVLNTFVMHHLPGDLKHRALVEMRRVLRAGGRVVVLDLQPTARPPRPWEPGWFVSRLHGQHPTTEADVKAAREARAALMRDAGYTSVRAGTTSHDWIGYAVGRVPE